VYALSPYPVLIALSKRLSHTVEVASAAVQDQLGVLSARVQENVAGMAVVRAYTMESREIESFRRLNGEFLSRSLRLARTQAANWPFMGLISGIGTLIVLWVGGKAVVEGRVSLGAFVAFNGYLAYLVWPTIALGWTLAGVRRGLASMERIGEVLDARPEPEERGAARETATPAPGNPAAASQAWAEGPIEVRDLTFAYEGRPPALSHVSFRAPAGALVAVVGSTGSGKSTLGALLCRLFEPPPGAIRVGEVDVRDLRLERLRGAIGYVPQEPFLFSRSLRDNVLFGAPDAGAEGLATAAAAAGLAEEVEAFPDGWDTVVGERGLTLSGGQRQRAALARALVGDPPILVLDDPFAAVDPGKEGEILAAIRTARRGRTTLLMTHRLRAAQEADWIVALSDGRLVEQGPHEDLLRRGGLYARFWRIQQIEDELAQA
jgi:ATP-binding cassette, subfamily B, multidrug efflux pump